MTLAPQPQAPDVGENDRRAPLVIGITPARGEPLVWLWAPESALELANYVADEMMAAEDVLVLVARSTPRPDLVHVLRELANFVERCEPVEQDMGVSLPRRSRTRRTRSKRAEQVA